MTRFLAITVLLAGPGGLMAAPVPQRMPVGGAAPAPVAVETPEPVIEKVLAELLPFPPAWMADQWAAYSRGHAEWAEHQAAMYPSEAWLAEYAAAAAWRANCWGLLSAAHDGHRVSIVGRFGVWWICEDTIEELANLLGEEDFEAGRMPAPVPTWGSTWAH